MGAGVGIQGAASMGVLSFLECLLLRGTWAWNCSLSCLSFLLYDVPEMVPVWKQLVREGGREEAWGQSEQRQEQRWAPKPEPVGTSLGHRTRQTIAVG